jgi:hypothetical protein
MQLGYVYDGLSACVYVFVCCFVLGTCSHFVHFTCTWSTNV